MAAYVRLHLEDIVMNKQFLFLHLPSLHVTWETFSVTV